MAFDPIQVTFVSIGRWNKFLFTGSWVSTNLFGIEKGQEFQALVSPDLEFIFPHKGISFQPKESSVQMVVNPGEKDVKGAVKDMNFVSTKLFTLLPHTPIQASGFNVTYFIGNEKNGGELISRIRKNIEQLASPNLDSMSFKDIKGDFVLNIIVNGIQHNGFNLTLNFHYDDRYKISSNSFSDNYAHADKLVNG